MKDMTENCKFIAKKIEDAFELKGSNEPQNTFGTYSPWERWWKSKFLF